MILKNCEKCARRIKLVKTKAGRWVPVDTPAEKIYPVQKGRRTYVLEDGRLIYGEPCGEALFDGYSAIEGNRLHFETCGKRKQEEDKR